jgi:hypothetical protein
VFQIVSTYIHAKKRFHDEAVQIGLIFNSAFLRARLGSLTIGRPDAFAKQSPEKSPSPFVANMNIYTLILKRKKVAQLFVLHLQFSRKLPKGNSRPIGENSPNLVTLGLPNSFNVRRHAVVGSRVARFFTLKHTKTGKIIPNEQKYLYQVTIKYQLT